MWAKIRKDIRWEKSHVKLLGVTIDINLSFDTHDSKFCSKTNRKFTALSRMSKFFSLEKRGRIIKDYMKEFLEKLTIITNYLLKTCSKKANHSVYITKTYIDF